MQKVRWHHIFGQRRLYEITQCPCRPLHSFSQHYISYQTWISGLLFTHSHYALLYVRATAQYCLDLAWLDTIAAHFYLLVSSAQEFYAAIFAPTGQIPRSIEPLPRSDRGKPCPYEIRGVSHEIRRVSHEIRGFPHEIRGFPHEIRGFSHEWVGDEAFGSQVGAMEIAVSQTDASDVDFSCYAYGDWLSMGIEQVDLHIPQCTAY